MLDSPANKHSRYKHIKKDEGTGSFEEIEVVKNKSSKTLILPDVWKDLHSKYEQIKFLKSPNTLKTPCYSKMQTRTRMDVLTRNRP